MKISIKNTLGVLFMIIIILLFIKSLVANWTQIQSFHFHLNIPLYIFSTSVLLLVIFLWGVFWNLLLRDLNFKKFSFQESFNIQAQAWFGKYLPGKVGVIGIKLFLGKKKGIDSTTIGISTIYENVFQLISALAVSLPILFYYSLKELKENPFLYQIFPLLLIVGLFIFVHPRVFFYFINIGLKLIKKQPISKEYFLTSGQIVKYIILYSIGMIIAGIAFFLFIQSITPFSAEYLIPTIGIFSFAGIIGMLAIFVPAGIGVREGIIVLLLQNYMPFEVAILISILSRLWTTVADGFLSIYILVERLTEKTINK